MSETLSQAALAEQAVKSAEKKPINVAKIKEILEANDGARMRAWLSVCSRCGLCADSCFFFQASKDPKVSPAYKVKASIGELFKRNGEVDRPFLESLVDIIWGQCTTCKRCSQYCPFGIDIASMIAVARAVCNSQGIGPEGLLITTAKHLATGNQMGMETDEFIETCEWMAEETGEEIKGLTIPVDLKGAKYMYTVNAREPMYYPQDLAMAAKIFTVAEESWTMPSIGWDCTNLAMFAGDKKVAAHAVNLMYDKAKELGVEAIVITECGHAFRSAKYEGPYLAGYANGLPPLPVIHSVELFNRYLKEGRIKIDPSKKLTEPVTYQDPCNVSRNGGLWEEGRELVHALCTDFRDMSPNRDHNHCCGGGGGYIPMGAPFKARRMASGRIKAEQIKATGAKYIIVPCHNCFDQINDLNKEYNLGVKVVSFKELITESMIIPDKFQPDDDADQGEE